MTRLAKVLALIATAMLVASCASVPAGSPETGYTIHGFVGETSQTAAPGVTVALVDGASGQVVATAQTNFMGKYGFPGLQPGHYQLKVGEIVQDVVIGGENVRRDIDLSKPTGAMNYAEAGMKELTDQLTAAATGKAVAAGPNDEELASQIAGTWWGYSGSTETKIGLCPDGSYADFSESSYSGTLSGDGSWSTAGQSGGQGVWTIQGTTESGTITVTYNNGNTATIEYRQFGEKGCLMFDGRKLCRRSAQCE